MSIINPFGSKILNTLFCTRRIRDGNLILKTEIESEFLMLSFKLNQSFKAEGKKNT